MIHTRGIAMSSGLNRKNHYFPLSSIFNAYEQVWNYGTPSNLNHDSSKLIGWNYITGIYIEPGKAYVTNELQIPETDEEQTALGMKNNAYLYEKYYIDRKEKYDELEAILGDKLRSKCHPALISCVAYEDKGILLRVFPELKDEMHKGLIDLRLLTPVYPGVFKKGKYLIFAHRFFRRNCSMLNSLNDDFLERLQKLQSSDLKVQIALDLDLIGLLGTENRELEYQFWWGPKFNEELSSIPTGVIRHQNEHYDNLFTNLCFTEFGWYIQDERQTFECEEISDRPNIKSEDREYHGCRFVHSMLNPDTNLPYHLDGAIRAYSDEQMVERLDISMDKSERDTWYTKLWRIDNDMPVSLWKELITHYYRDNMLIGEYFSGEDEKFSKIVLEDKKQDEVVAIEKYIPVNTKQGDGLRFYFQYLPKYSINEKYDVTISSQEFLLYNDRRIKVMESETITVLKLLSRYGVKVRVPFTERIGHEDMIFNFPTFVCRDLYAAGKVQQAIYELCVAWSDESNDRIISYSIITNLSKNAIKLSFAGHVADVVNIFNSVGLNFPDEENFYTWIEKLYNKNGEYICTGLQVKVFDILNELGNLRYRRQLVPNQYLQNIQMESRCLTTSFIERKEVVQEMIDNAIGIAPRYLIEKTKCTQCKTDYRFCNCVKFIDDCGETIEKNEYLGAVWTNRHA